MLFLALRFVPPADWPSAALVLSQAGDLIDHYSLIERGGIVGGLFLAVLALQREWIVPGSRLRQLNEHWEQRQAEWQERLEQVEAERARMQQIVESSLPMLATSTEILKSRVLSAGKD